MRFMQHSSKKKFFLSILLSLWIFPASLKAKSEDLSIPPTPETNPALREARMAETLAHVPDIVLPYYYMKGLTYPLSRLGNWVDGNRYSQKAVELVSAKRKALTVYPIITVGDGSRFGGGFGLTDTNFLKDNYIFTLRGVVYTDLDVRAEAALGKRNAFQFKNKNFSFVTGADWFMDSDEDYYGIGPNTSDSNKGEFSVKLLRTGGAIGVEILPHFMIAPHFVFDWGRSGYRALGDVPSVELVFPASELQGFGQTIAYADLGFRLSHDTRNNYYYPEKGGLRAVTLHYMKGLNHSGFDFFKLNLNVEQYFKLPPPRLVVWLHTAWSFEEKTKGNEIPFYRLTALDVFSPLRGFNRGRFRDKSSAVFNAELRYPLWNNLDGTVFVDTGRVFNGIQHFAFKDFKYSAGGGFRLTVHKYYIFKMEVAYGGEGVNTIFRAIQEL